MIKTNEHLPLNWYGVDERAPPVAKGTPTSPALYLAMEDGSVHQGSCLHKPDKATYKALVHGWFYIDKDCKKWAVSNKNKVLMWTLIPTVPHPIK